MNRLFVCVAFAAACMAFVSHAETAQPVQQNNSNAIWFENWIGLRNATMVVATPEGELVTVYSDSGTPVFELSGKEIQDGIYRYELNAATEEEMKIVNNIDNGRGDAAKDTTAKPFYLSGAFVVQRGVIVPLEETKEEG
jgi:hypothetical protein